MNEGQSITFAAAVAASPTDTDLTRVVLDFGDGSSQVICDDATATPCGVSADCAASHLYTNSQDTNGTTTAGDHTAVCSGTGNNGGAGSSSAAIRIDNVASTVDAGGPYGTLEDVSFSPTGSFSDPGSASETYECVWDFDTSETTTPLVTIDPCTPANVNTGVSHTYTTPGTYTLQLSVRDKSTDGSTVSDTGTVVVSDTNPTISAIADAPDPSDEGASVSVSATITAPSAEPVTTCQWDFGDGTVEAEDECASAADPTNVAVSATHVYADNGPYTIRLIANDADSQSQQTQAHTVNNVAPTVEAGGPHAVTEGVSASFTASFTDPAGSLDAPFSCTFDWGDGSATTTVPNCVSGTSTASHVYDDTLATRTLTLSVTDADGGTGSDTAVVQIADYTPGVAMSNDSPQPEGTAVTFTYTITQAVQDLVASCSWNFADGTTAGPFAAGSPECRVDGTASTIAHAYGDNGSFTAVLSVTDEDATTTTNSPVTVTNANPVVVIDNVSPEPSNEGGGAAAPDQLVTLDFTVSDPGSAANEIDSVTVTWGETGSAAEVVCDADGATAPPACSETSYTVTHTYQDDSEDICGAATCTITVTANDKDLGSGSATALHDVNNVAPVITSVTLVSPVAEGSAVSVSVEAEDAGAGDAPSLRYDFDWNGDGCNSAQGDFCNATLNGASHFYPDEGDYALVITVRDDDGGSDTENRTARVTDTKPVIVATFNTAPKLEGQGVTAVANMNLQEGDSYSFTWAWGDGSTTTTCGRTCSHAYGDQATRTITVTVVDDEGNSTSATSTAVIDNAAPAVSSTGCGSASGVSYSCDVNGTDVAADTIVYALSFGPAGMSVNAGTGVVSWTPSAQQSRSSHGFQVKVSDEDGGVQHFTQTVSSYADSDSDGLTDAWETEYGPSAPGDDPDGDGRTNAEEFANGTDPNVFDGPHDPTVAAPPSGSETVSAQPVLAVRNATDPEGDALTYTFEVFSDASLQTLVASTNGVAEGTQFVDGAYHTSWTVNAALSQNTEYWWRARAHDGAAFGANSVVASFFVNTANEAPSSPTLSAPQDASHVPTLHPTLQIGNASDVDRDDLTYTFEIATSSAFTTIVSSASSVAEGNGTTSWTSGAALSDDTTYFWRARAVDEDGMAGPNLASGTFFVNTSNNPPSVVGLLGPVDGTEVTTATPTFSISNGTDSDGNTLTYEFEIDDSPAFDAPVSSGPVAEAAPGQTSFVPPAPLTENRQHWWRARAFDGNSAGDWTTASFFVNSANDAPAVPAAQNPVNGSLVDRDNVAFTVRNVEDPDRDVVTYTFRIYTNEALTALHDEEAGVAAGGNGETTYVPAARLSAGKNYWWVAVAVDDAGLASAASPSQQFKTIGGGGGGGCAVGGTPSRMPLGLLFGAALAMMAFVRRKAART